MGATTRTGFWYGFEGGGAELAISLDFGGGFDTAAFCCIRDMGREGPLVLEAVEPEDPADFWLTKSCARRAGASFSLARSVSARLGALLGGSGQLIATEMTPDEG